MYVDLCQFEKKNNFNLKRYLTRNIYLPILRLEMSQKPPKKEAFFLEYQGLKTEFLFIFLVFFYLS